MAVSGMGAEEASWGMRLPVTSTSWMSTASPALLAFPVHAPDRPKPLRAEFAGGGAGRLGATAFDDQHAVRGFGHPQLRAGGHPAQGFDGLIAARNRVSLLPR